MKIHHLNCGTLCPTGMGLLFRGETKLVCHCIAVETKSGLVLIDTGFGIEDCRSPMTRLGPSHKFVGPLLQPQETALEQIQRLGYSRDDVKHLIVTHLDFDHAGGIADFPNAIVHVMADEYEMASNGDFSIQNFQRYRKVQWQNHKNWKFHSPQGENWFGFEAIHAIPGCEDQILLIPLAGHTKGHAGIAINTASGWLFHAGDCYYSHASMNLDNFRIPRGLAGFEKLMAYDDELRLANLERLRELKRQYRSNIDFICAHDSYDFTRFKK